MYVVPNYQIVCKMNATPYQPQRDTHFRSYVSGKHTVDHIIQHTYLEYTLTQTHVNKVVSFPLCFSFALFLILLFPFLLYGLFLFFFFYFVLLVCYCRVVVTTIQALVFCFCLTTLQYYVDKSTWTKLLCLQYSAWENEMIHRDF